MNPPAAVEIIAALRFLKKKMLPLRHRILPNNKMHGFRKYNMFFVWGGVCGTGMAGSVKRC